MNSRIIIREEKESDWYATELMTRSAFWNLNMPGSDEHYLVYKVRSDESFVPELSRIAELDGEIIGAIFYEKAYVQNGEKRLDVLTFGPLAVAPEHQKTGVGSALLTYTMELAKKQGHKAILICGVAQYYPRHGFLTADHFGITMSDGTNFDAFMGIELEKGALSDIGGKFYEPKVFGNFPLEVINEYDKKFPFAEKLVFPGQWRKLD